MSEVAVVVAVSVQERRPQEGLQRPVVLTHRDQMLAVTEVSDPARLRELHDLVDAATEHAQRIVEGTEDLT